MKKRLSMVLGLVILVSLILSLTSCQETGQSYETDNDMKKAVYGIWTTEDARYQLKITRVVVILTYRDANYTDTISKYTELGWDSKKGRIQLGDTDEYLLVEEGGAAIIKDDMRFLPGGELAVKPIPESTLYEASMSQIYQYGIWSADMDTLCRRVTRNTKAAYYRFDEYIDSFDKPEELIKKEEELGGDAYFVTLTGDVSQNATLANFYHPTAQYATFFIVLKEGEVLYVEKCYISGTFMTAALTYFSSGY